MKSDLIHSLTEDFEGHAQQTESGVEYWLARDLQHLLGYAEWRNFNQSAISKAKTVCEVSGHGSFCWRQQNGPDRGPRCRRHPIL